MSLKYLSARSALLCPLRSQCLTSLDEYSGIFIFLVVSLLISCVVSAPSYFLGTWVPNKEKVSAYECGSNPSEDARNQFDVRFYLVAILFITPDPEVSLSSPRAVTSNQITISGPRPMSLSLLILTVGFVHEWKKGALE